MKKSYNVLNRGGQIIRLPITENSPTVTELSLTAYHKIKKIENRNKKIYRINSRSVIW
jgi:hypothetical protein